MKKVENEGLKLNSDEFKLLGSEIASSRKWIGVSGIIAVVIFGGILVVGVVGYFLGLILLTSNPHVTNAGDTVVFAAVGVVAILFTSVCVWLGASAIKTAAKARDFTLDNSVTDLINYHMRLKNLFKILSGIAIFGLVMCVLGAAFLVIAFGLGPGIPIID